MEIVLNKRTIRLDWHNVIYFTALLAYALYLGTQLEYNTAFVDEAIYATVGEGILRNIFWEDAISWMGGYYIYPLIAAKINHWFGLAGIRLFAMFCVMITAVAAGKIAKQFTSRTGEVLTVIIFLFWANALNLGQMGTYDAPSLAFMAVSAYLAVNSRYQENENIKIVQLFISSVLFSLAVLTKYVAIFFAPALILLVYNPQPRKKFFDLINKKAIAELFIWGLPVTAVLSIYFGMYFEKLLNFATGGHSYQPTDYIELLTFTWDSMNIILVGGLLGGIYAYLFKRGEKKWLTTALLIGGIAPLAYHFGTVNIRSYWKHMVFSGFFLTPLLSWMLIKIYKTGRSYSSGSAISTNITQVLVTVFAIAITTSLWSSFSEHWRFQRSWPSATPSIEYLSEVLQPDDKILAEAGSVYKYHMFTGFEDPASWPSTWYMEYEGLFGTEAMIAGIEDQYFDYVVLNDYYTKYVNDQLRPHLQEHYEIVFEDDYEIQGVYTQNTAIWAPKDNGIAITE